MGSPTHFFGQLTRTLSTANLYLAETVFPAGLDIPRHSHENACFCFVLEGSLTERYEHRERRPEGSTLIFHPADERHSEKFASRTRGFSIAILDSLLAGFEERPFQLAEPAEFRNGNPALLATRLYREFRRMDDASALVIEGLGMELIGECIRSLCPAESGRPPWLNRVHERLQDSFADDLSLRQLALLAGVHPVHLARTFRNHFGCSVGEYVRRLRVECASERLKATDLPLVDVAIESGFCTQSHFSTIFKQSTGMTPGEYRDAHGVKPTKSSSAPDRRRRRAA